jgi:hypothetical protein
MKLIEKKELNSKLRVLNSDLVVITLLKDENNPYNFTLKSMLIKMKLLNS